MKKIIILGVALLSYSLSIAQYYTYIGDNKYEATEPWTFKLQTPFWGAKYISVQIAKHANGGYLILSIATLHQHQRLAGNVFLFLYDGARITCIDRNIHDYVDKRSTAVYNLTKNEINQLKTSRIKTIRVSLFFFRADSNHCHLLRPTTARLR